MFANTNELLSQAGHRPWPLPSRPWVMAMRWDRLLFAHWRVPEKLLLPHLPAGLDLDLFDGSAWLGITPFVVSQARPRGLPPIPFLSTFPEVNVRTYVTCGGKAGVWFFSLDAASALAVFGARTFYFLPYFHARMSVAEDKFGIAYTSTRLHPRSGGPMLRIRYEPDGADWTAPSGSLDHWLIERYCLYAAGPNGGISRGDIHHPPWRLQPARASIDVNTMAASLGLSLEGSPILHYSHKLDVVVWPLCAVD